MTVRAPCSLNPHTAVTADREQHPQQQPQLHPGLLSAFPKVLIPPVSLAQCLTYTRTTPGREQGLEGSSGSVPSAAGYSAALISSRALNGAAIKLMCGTTLLVVQR